MPSDWRTVGLLVALFVANIALAFGPWFVRLADTGPVAAAFWRMALALPLIVMLAIASGTRVAALRLPGKMWVLLALAGVAFAMDLGSWHVGILQTTLANATLFGNSATFIFPIYGFVVARNWPTRTQGLALLLAALGAGLLMGRSYQLDPRHLVGDLLCVLAGVLYAVYFVLMSGVRRTMAPWPALALSSLAALVPLLAILMPPTNLRVPVTVVAVVLALAVGGDLGEQLHEHLELTHRLGMNAIVEAHTEEEVDRAVATGAKIIGINTRNLKTLETDPAHFATLADRIPEGRLIVAESGVTGPEVVADYAAAGADVVLVGEALVRTEDPREAVSEFRNHGRRARAARLESIEEERA